MFGLAASEEFWGLLTSVVIQRQAWDRRGSGGGDQALDGSEVAALCDTLRCHSVVFEVSGSKATGRRRGQLSRCHVVDARARASALGWGR